MAQERVRKTKRPADSGDSTAQMQAESRKRTAELDEILDDSLDLLDAIDAVLEVDNTFATTYVQKGGE